MPLHLNSTLTLSISLQCNLNAPAQTFAPCMCIIRMHIAHTNQNVRAQRCTNGSTKKNGIAQTFAPCRYIVRMHIAHTKTFEHRDARTLAQRKIELRKPLRHACTLLGCTQHTQTKTFKHKDARTIAQRKQQKNIQRCIDQQIILRNSQAIMSQNHGLGVYVNFPTIMQDGRC